MEKSPINQVYSEIPIQKIGSYFELDNNGYIINPTSHEKIQDEWKPALEEIINGYKQEYGSNLSSIYIRGSVAKGTAVKDISDVDSFGYVNLSKKDISYEWADTLEKEITDKYSFIQGVELGVDPVGNTLEDRILLAQSLCIYGEDISQKMPKIKLGRELAIHAPKLEQSFNWLRKKLETLEDQEDLRKGCLWLMKLFLRTGFELTIERSNTYTRDLYPCYEMFSHYYPEKEPEMRKILYLALNPIADLQMLQSMISGFGRWLESEVKVQFP